MGNILFGESVGPGDYIDLTMLFTSSREEFMQCLEANFTDKELEFIIKSSLANGFRRSRWDRWQKHSMDLYRNDEHIGMK